MYLNSNNNRYQSRKFLCPKLLVLGFIFWPVASLEQGPIRNLLFFKGKGCLYGPFSAPEQDVLYSAGVKPIMSAILNQ